MVVKGIENELNVFLYLVFLTWLRLQGKNKSSPKSYFYFCVGTETNIGLSAFYFRPEVSEIVLMMCLLTLGAFFVLVMMETSRVVPFFKGVRKSEEFTHSERLWKFIIGINIFCAILVVIGIDDRTSLPLWISAPLAVSVVVLVAIAVVKRRRAAEKNSP